MAKTFDNISEASATNYLFLFAQRTLALQNEPPTPPPLNALGMPCNAICLLWDLLQKKDKTPAPEKTASEQATTAAAVTLEAAAVTLEAAAETAEASPSSPPPSPSSGEGAAAAEKLKAMQGGAEKEKTFAETIAPLAEKVTAYILDHQDDAAQEDRWRTTMKRKMSESFRAQREAAKKQRESIDGQFNRQREEVQKVETEVQSMQHRFDDVHSKLDETIQLVRNLALHASYEG